MAADLYNIDGAVLRDEAAQAQAEQALEMVQAVNLDEVDIEDIEVAFVEYEEVTDKGGRKRHKAHKRTAYISTYVPMRLLNKMLASQRKAQTLKKRVDAGQLEVDEDPMMVWISRQVFEVWKLSEPDMTYERFEKGLDLEKVMGLFGRFFGSTLQKLRGKA